MILAAQYRLLIKKVVNFLLPHFYILFIEIKEVERKIQFTLFKSKVKFTITETEGILDIGLFIYFEPYVSNFNENVVIHTEPSDFNFNENCIYSF